ncbi:hypothetical protein AVEN_263070-1 [Araneus ventricosus]|uniref:Uncharacterized protein n=1 Tax=Araneus ventricosus TaxID=182803 RepID=A0A4Y2MU34_ARAVE|nr:hypothetical protein AVEN_263070-1 [Araneus ventricosus]
MTPIPRWGMTPIPRWGMTPIPRYAAVITVAFMTFGPKCVICNLVPLRSLGISRLRISSTGTPTFNLGLSEGAPDNSKMLKSSTEYDVPFPYLQMDIL